MRVLLGAFGTRGDVQPLLGLAQGLRRAGHSVVMAVPPSAGGLAAQFGIDALQVGLDFEEVMRRAARGTLGEVLSLLPLLRSQLTLQYEALHTVAADCDVIVGASVFATGSVLSESLGVPYVFITLCPQLVPSAWHPPPTTPSQTWPRWANRAAWWVNGTLWQLMLGGELKALRRRLGLKSTDGVWKSFLGSRVLVASDPLLASLPPDVTGVLAQTGAFAAHDASPLSESVEAFLRRGPPPVFIGFGSMADPHPKRTAARLIESARRAGVRALISRGWAGLEADSHPDDVAFIGSEPHAQLFPRCAAVVHHGGAGTTHTAAKAGVPQVIMPQLLDQHFWAHHCARAGIAPPPVPRHHRDPERLARALRACVEDPLIRSTASSLAPTLIPDGIGRAISALEALVSVAR